MARIHFTKRTIEALKPKAQRYYVHADDACKGLVLAVQPSGNKSFYLYRRIKGRPRQVFIGRFPDVTVEQAKTEAIEWNGEVAKGNNPATQRKRERSNRFTLGQIWDDYRTKHLEPHSSPPSLSEDCRR